MSAWLKAPHPLLSNHFKNMHHNRMFDMTTIEGRQGIGKTQFMMWVLYGIYGDWDKVLPHLFMELGAAMRYMREYKNTTRKIPCIGFDDAGVYAGKYKMFEKGGFQFISKLNSVLDLARESTHGITLTSPDEDVASFLRSKSWMLTQIKWMRNYQGIRLEPTARVATTYRRKKRPDGKVYPKKVCVDIFHINSIPGDLVKEYYAIRNRVTDPFYDAAIEEVSKISHPTEVKDWLARMVMYDKDERQLTFEQIAQEYKAKGILDQAEIYYRRLYHKHKSTPTGVTTIHNDSSEKEG